MGVLLCIVSIILIAILGRKIYCINRKRNRINELRKEIYEKKIPVDELIKADNLAKDNKDKSVTFAQDEAAMMGVGVANMTLSLFDIYSSVNQHSKVIEVLEQRAPSAFGELSDLEIASKFSKAGEGTINAWVNLYKGQAAENAALEYLRKQGLDAHLFDSLTNESNDIFVLTETGETINYSVKCGDLDYIEYALNNSEATNYIINSEAYKTLEEQGRIAYYSNQGKMILDAGFSDEALSEIGTSALEDMSDSMDSLDGIPLIAIGMLIYKTGNNIIKYSEGKESGTELCTDIAADALKVGVGSISAYAGGKVGEFIGEAIASEFGGIAGSTIGAVAGAIAGGRIISHFREQAKWGDIIEAQLHFGNKLIKYNEKHVLEQYIDDRFNMEELVLLYEEESNLYWKYENQLNPYNSEPVTLQAVLAEAYYNHIGESIDRINYIKMNIGHVLHDYLDTVAAQISKHEKKRNATLLAGEIMIHNERYLSLNAEETRMIDLYYEQLEKSKGYPYRFSKDVNSILEALLHKTQESYKSKKKTSSFGSATRTPMILLYTFAVILGIILMGAAIDLVTPKHQGSFLPYEGSDSKVDGTINSRIIMTEYFSFVMPEDISEYSVDEYGSGEEHGYAHAVTVCNDAGEMICSIDLLPLNYTMEPREFSSYIGIIVGELEVYGTNRFAVCIYSLTEEAYENLNSPLYLSYEDYIYLIMDIVKSINISSDSGEILPYDELQSVEEWL